MKIPSTAARRIRRTARRAFAGGALTALATLAAFTPHTLVAQEAVPTEVVVRAVAQDAKIIGSGVGGAHITIRAVHTGEVLARGIQEGGTGDTGLIMGERARGAAVHDTEGAAAFRARIPLTEPTRVEVVARGPLGTPHAVQQASTTLLLIPGEDLVGEGVVLTLHGFTVEILGPVEESAVAPGEPVTVRARVTMLCGCPTEPGGRWDSDRYRIRAQWVRDGRVLGEEPLAFSGSTSEYEAELPAPDAEGPVTLRILASDAERANTGMAEALVVVRR